MTKKRNDWFLTEIHVGIPRKEGVKYEKLYVPVKQGFLTLAALLDSEGRDCPYIVIERVKEES